MILTDLYFARLKGCTIAEIMLPASFTSNIINIGLQYRSFSRPAEFLRQISLLPEAPVFINKLSTNDNFSYLMLS